MFTAETDHASLVDNSSADSSFEYDKGLWDISEPQVVSPSDNLAWYGLAAVAILPTVFPTPEHLSGAAGIIDYLGKMLETPEGRAVVIGALGLAAGAGHMWENTATRPALERVVRVGLEGIKRGSGWMLASMAVHDWYFGIKMPDLAPTVVGAFITTNVIDIGATALRPINWIRQRVSGTRG